MTTKVIFHQLDFSIDFTSDDFVAFACDFVANQQTIHKYITVYCASQNDAHQIDQVLWRLPVHRFVPHNLYGEGDGNASPVEIGWLDEASSQLPINNRNCLVSFSQTFLANTLKFREIHEFVPADETSKGHARTRFVQYKQQGCALTFLSQHEKPPHSVT